MDCWNNFKLTKLSCPVFCCYFQLQNIIRESKMKMGEHYKAQAALQKDISEVKASIAEKKAASVRFAAFLDISLILDTVGSLFSASSCILRMKAKKVTDKHRKKAKLMIINIFIICLVSMVTH